MSEEKMQKAKNKLFELMKPFIDENKCINLSAFRKAHPDKYGLLPHYFGGVDDAMLELGLVKVHIVKQKGASRDLCFKDKLSLDMLNLLRTTESFDSIATRYGVTKPLVAQLHKALKLAAEKISKDKKTEKTEEAEKAEVEING